MIKLGVIGMSDGNAHPTSWSAIINGVFDRAEIEQLGFPAVADYLEANKATLGLPQAKVTHVFTQDLELSKSIARSAGIDHVANSLEEMIAGVDAILLSRDDPERHREFADPILKAGIPLFIDKPLAHTIEDLNYFKSQHKDGKLLMSCSSMRYAPECMVAKTGLSALGEVQLITAVGKKDWTKYGVHMLEAIFTIMNDPQPISVTNIGEAGAAIVKVAFEGGWQATIHLYQEISGTFQLSLFGKKGWKLVEIQNSYAMFRNNIIEFLRSVEEGHSRLAFETTEQIIKTLIAGQKSLDQGGVTIYIKDL